MDSTTSMTMESDVEARVAQNKHNKILDDLNNMNKELEDLEDMFFSLGMRSHILEIEVASQFSPDGTDEEEKVFQMCQECQQTVNELAQNSSSEKTSINQEPTLTEKEGFPLVSDDSPPMALERQLEAMETNGDDGGAVTGKGDISTHTHSKNIDIQSTTCNIIKSQEEASRQKTDSLSIETGFNNTYS